MFCLVGSRALSFNSAFRGVRSKFLTIIRLSLAYTLLASSLFSGGVFNNNLNTTLPVFPVGLMGVLFVVGLVSCWVMVVFSLDAVSDSSNRGYQRTFSRA